MNTSTVLTLLAFIYQLTLTNSARILGIVPTPSYSHQIIFRPIWKELSLRGHQLTVLTTDPVKDKSLTNLTEIDLSFSYKTWNENVLDMVNTADNVNKMLEVIINTMNNITQEQLSHQEVRELIDNKNEHFDLLIVEGLIPIMFVFAERFKCPFIGVMSFDAPIYSYELIGNPIHPVVYPDLKLSFVAEPTFMVRLGRVVNYILEYFMMPLYFKEVDNMVKKYFGDNYPPISEIEKKMSMLFVNADPVFHLVRPLVPAVVQIGGGTHRDPPKPLPKELQKHLDSATQGFIYFSLGSNVKSKDLSERTRKVILDTFAGLPYKVLWKFELEELPGRPDNVIISKWFPQQDVFKHPNIKLFITQGGLQSIDEAIYDHVPIVGLPFFADQPGNIERIVHKGLGLSLDHKTLDKETFKRTILEVIDNPKYKNRMTELATLAQDQSMTGLEKAVWWTEYVLRHKGASHLRSPALDLPTYQHFLLDVIGFCVLVVAIIIFAIIKLLRLISRFIGYVLGKFKIKTE